MSESTQIALGVLSLMGVILGAYATYRSGVRGKAIEAEASPYDALATRVVALEAEVQGQRQQLRSLERRFRLVSDALLEQHEWQLAGANPPPPTISPLAIAAIIQEEPYHD